MSIDACFTGRAGSAPELKTAKSGKPWSAFSVAVTNGADTNDATWVRVCMFGGTAENMSAKIEKGAKVYCEGRLELQTYTGRDGQQRTGLQLAAHHVTIMGPKANKQPRAKAADEGEHAPPPANGSDHPLDDCIPF